MSTSAARPLDFETTSSGAPTVLLNVYFSAASRGATDIPIPNTAAFPAIAPAQAAGMLADAVHDRVSSLTPDSSTWVVAIECGMDSAGYEEYLMNDCMCRYCPRKAGRNDFPNDLAECAAEWAGRFILATAPDDAYYPPGQAARRPGDSNQRIRFEF